MPDAISVTETNKIRIALGLKPLADPSAGADDSGSDDSSSEDEASTLETRQAAASDNWRELEEARIAKEQRSARQEAIKKARDSAKRFAQLEGKGLGEASDDEEQDARAWLKSQKKRQKKIAQQWEQQLAEQEREALANAKAYGSEDLAGIKVGHEMDEFGDGEAILTLKDTAVDGRDDDELENVALVEQGKTKERLDAKKRKIVYNPNDNLDSDQPRGILSQYDEEIDGKQRKRFTLDGKGRTEEEKEALRAEVGEKAKKLAISLENFVPSEPQNDYLDPSTVKVKKPKKSKRSTRQREVDEDDIIAPVTEAKIMEPSRKRVFEDASLVDDDDLQASLTQSRRQALKKRKKLTPEELAKQMREEEPEMDVDIEQPGLVIDETSEFVSGLQKPEPEIVRRSGQVKREPSSSPELAADADGDIAMDVKPEEDAKAEEPEEEDLTSTGITAEGTVDQGIAATLNMLTSRGLLDRSGADLADKTRQHQLFLAAKHRREVQAESQAKSQRERDRNSGRLANMSAREREEYARQENKSRDLQETRRMAELFNAAYKPNVELKYIDEHGRRVGPKEAFKTLSHQFHGKGSGKGKTEKKLKKIADEKKREQEGLLDSSQRRAGLDSAMGELGKREGKAGVRLQ